MHYLCCEEDTRILKDIVKETTQENEDIFYDI